MELHIDRVRTRVLEGGHDVPEADIRRRYKLSLVNLNNGVELADTVVILDNTEQESAILLEMQYGQVIYHANLWPNWLRNSLRV